MTLTRRHDPAGSRPDPRLSREAPRAFRASEAPPACSCGCKAPHEVARRRTFDGATLVVLSTGEVRLISRGGMAPCLTVHVDRFSAPVRRLLDWAEVMNADEVERDLLSLHDARWGAP